MKQKLIFLILIIGFIGLGIGLIRIIDSRVSRQGILRIDSRPAVSAFIDNRQLAKTPFEVKQDKGEYTLKLVAESNLEPVSSWQGKIKIYPNLLTYVNADLAQTEFESAIDVIWLEKTRSKLPEIALTSTPDGASISVNGIPKGVTPIVISDTGEGDHVISFAAGGFLPRTVKIKANSGYRLMLSVKMALAAKSVNDINGVTAVSDVDSIETTGSGDLLSDSVESTKSSNPQNEIPPTPSKKLPPKPYVVISDTPTGFLRVRLGPSTQATEAAKVYPGETYSYLDADSGWYKISYEETKEGWISSQYAEKVE